MYKRVQLEDGQPVQFDGVYVIRWKPEWGQPTVGFVEAEYTLEDALDELMDVQLTDNTHDGALHARDEIEEILIKLARG